MLRSSKRGRGRRAADIRTFATAVSARLIACLRTTRRRTLDRNKPLIHMPGTRLFAANWTPLLA